MSDPVEKMLNQAALEALYSATYVDNFLDTVENLPDEVQREISSMRELDVRYQALLQDMEGLRGQLEGELDSISLKRIMVQIQDKLISTQEIGDDKLQIVQHILDIIENRQRQLELDSKNLDFGQEPEKQETSKETQPERASKRARRTRNENATNHNENSNDAPVTPHVEKVSTSKSSAQKKATKKKKRKAKVEREREDSPTEIPIDPDEPTYCLCEQVSYGEMIGCDNDLCPIEWFHFSCVGLTNKPKGKWFCPKCRGDKPTVMKPRAQFLKELEKYNKEKEEKS
ncbi:inhibitor of growth protein 1-like [Penaeus japonicus]|uniref:inhibitor of growth protein 1-like n=1 Tax=Penaeus japonicus TaxID=27405 RepID=UPI001C7137CC|nr:inhibitor of growth protein 1-like [Penaeus japonicus]